MPDKIKSIQEALVEVQRKLDINKTINEGEFGTSLGAALHGDYARAGENFKKGVSKTYDKGVALTQRAGWLANRARQGIAGALDPEGDSKEKYTAPPDGSSAATSVSVNKEPAAAAPAPVGKEPAAPASSSAPTAEKPAAPSGDKPVSVKHSKGGDYNIYAKGSEKAADFRKTYAAAKGNFEWEGRKYAKPSSETSTAKPTATTAKPAPLPPRRPDDLGKVNAPTPPRRPSDLPKPTASGLSVPTIGTVSGKYNPDKERSARLSFQAPDAEGIAKTKWVGRGVSTYKAEKPEAFDDNRLDPSVTSGNAEFPMSNKLVKPETESGKKVKKMSEETNPLIAAFLKLQQENPSNMFEAAKKAKKDHDRDGKIESEKDEVWGSRFAAAKKAGKMEEATLKDPKDPSVQGSGDVTVDAPKHVKPTNPERIKNMKDPRDPSVQGSGDVTYKEEVELDEISSKLAYKASDVALKRADDAFNAGGGKAIENEFKRQYTKFHSYGNKARQKEATKKYMSNVSDAKKKRLGIKEEEQVEEINFSQAEIDHINSFFLEASVAPNRPEVAIGADSTSEGMSQNNVTGTAESGKRKLKEGTWSSSKMSHPRPMSLSSGGGLDPEKRKALAASMAKYKPNMKAGESDEEYKARTAKNAASQRAAVGMKEETLQEGGMPASVIAHKQKLVNMSDKEFSEKYGNKSEKELRDMAARHGYGWDKETKTGSDHYVRRVASTMKEETLEEGRPKKNPTPETTERDPRKHIQVEAGRAAAGNVIDFHHNDGSKSKITPAMGRKITSHLQGLKPADRQAAVNKMHDSAEGLKV